MATWALAAVYGTEGLLPPDTPDAPWRLPDAPVTLPNGGGFDSHLPLVLKPEDGVHHVGSSMSCHVRIAGIAVDCAVSLHYHRPTGKWWVFDWCAAPGVVALNGERFRNHPLSDELSLPSVITLMATLLAMKRAGIDRAYIGDIGGQDGPKGTVKTFSPEWEKALATAFETASEIGIELGLFNSPGWSQSGGPWVKPEQAMRRLVASSVAVTGPTKGVKLPAPKFESVPADEFQLSLPSVITLMAT